MPLYEYECPDCGLRFERTYKLDEKPKEVEATEEEKAQCSTDDCAGRLLAAVSAVRFCNIVHSGSTLRARNSGKISTDQMDKMQQQLLRRSAEHDRSREGVEQRDRAWANYNDRYKKSAAAMGYPNAQELPRKAFHIGNDDIKGDLIK